MQGGCNCVVAYNIFIISIARTTYDKVVHGFVFSPAEATFLVCADFKKFGFEIVG